MKTKDNILFNKSTVTLRDKYSFIWDKKRFDEGSNKFETGAGNHILGINENGAVSYGINYTSSIPYIGICPKGLDVFESDNYILEVFTSANFPDLGANATAIKAIPFSDGKTILITNSNQLYTNASGSWVEGKLWNLEGEQYKYPWGQPNFADAPAKNGNRYEVCLDQLGFNGNTGDSDIFQYMNSLTIIGDLIIIGNYNSSGMVPPIVFATIDGGINWYVKYMFSINTGEYYNDISGPLNTTSLPIFTHSFTVSKRINTVPTALDKNPTNKFEFPIVDLIVSSITKADGAVVTTISSHGLSNDDIVFFESVITPTDGWEKLLNDSTTVNSGGTGVFYRVSDVSPTTFVLNIVRGNPDNNIMCRHIHTVTQWGSGICVGTGEYYPYGWLIFARIESGFNNVEADWGFTRLTSSPESIQRSLGTLLLSEGKILHASDGELPFDTIATSRGSEITLKANTISKGLLSDADDSSLYDVKLRSGDAWYFLRDFDNVIIAQNDNGKLFVSTDEGESWSFIGTADTLRYLKGWKVDNEGLHVYSNTWYLNVK